MTITCGAQYVMTYGDLWMPMWPADSSDLPQQVGNLITSHINNTSVMLHHPGASLKE